MIEYPEDKTPNIVCRINLEDYTINEFQIANLASEFYGISGGQKSKGILNILFCDTDHFHEKFEATLKGGFSKVKNKK